MSDREVLVEVSGVSKTYRDHVAVHALRDVSFTLDRGEFAAVVGPSGSGKTTLLNVIGALDVPDAGVIRIAGHELTATPRDQLADFRLRRLGFVFQAYNLFPVLTVLENLEFVAVLQGVKPADRRRRARELLEASAWPGWRTNVRPSSAAASSSAWRSCGPS